MTIKLEDKVDNGTLVKKKKKSLISWTCVRVYLFDLDFTDWNLTYSSQSELYFNCSLRQAQCAEMYQKRLKGMSKNSTT